MFVVETFHLGESCYLLGVFSFGEIFSVKAARMWMCFFCLNPGTFTPWRGGKLQVETHSILSSNKGKKKGTHTLCWNNDRTWRWQKSGSFLKQFRYLYLHWPGRHYFTRSKIFRFWHLKSKKISGTPQRRCWFPLFLYALWYSNWSMILDSNIPNECKWYIKTCSPNVKSHSKLTHKKCMT